LTGGGGGDQSTINLTLYKAQIEINEVSEKQFIAQEADK
jgi:hypothetical protein